MKIPYSFGISRKPALRPDDFQSRNDQLPFLQKGKVQNFSGNLIRLKKGKFFGRVFFRHSDILQKNPAPEMNTDCLNGNFSSQSFGNRRFDPLPSFGGEENLVEIGHSSGDEERQNDGAENKNSPDLFHQVNFYYTMKVHLEDGGGVGDDGKSFPTAQSLKER